MTNKMKIFAERLKLLRQDNDLSVRKLAENLSISAIAISRWERELQVPNLNMIVLVADYFKVTPDYLMGYID